MRLSTLFVLFTLLIVMSDSLSNKKRKIAEQKKKSQDKIQNEKKQIKRTLKILEQKRKRLKESTIQKNREIAEKLWVTDSYGYSGIMNIRRECTMLTLIQSPARIFSSDDYLYDKLEMKRIWSSAMFRSKSDCFM